MISDTSTCSRKNCNPSTTRSVRGCHPCLRYRSVTYVSGWTSRHYGAGEALRLKFFFRFLSTTPIAYAFSLFLCWTHCWTFRSTLGLARLPLKTRSATMEIREGLVVTPVSATRRFPPTRWHPRRAGTGRVPKASRCWRRHSNSASVCTRIFVRRRRHRLSRGVAKRRNLPEN